MENQENPQEPTAELRERGNVKSNKFNVNLANPANPANPTHHAEKVCARPLKKRQPIETLLKTSVLEFFGFFTLIRIFALCISFMMRPVYLYSLVGFGVSALTSYFKIRMMLDPSYVPDCGCAGADDQSVAGVIDSNLGDALKVLSHKKSTILFNISNSVFGVFFYLIMAFLMYVPVHFSYFLVRLLCLVSCSGSVYLLNVMITEIGLICPLCMCIHAVNALMFSSLFF